MKLLSHPNGIALHALLCIMLWSCRGTPPSVDSGSDPEVIAVGAIIPLTGPDAFWGKNIQNGIELAKQEINTSGGILNLQINVVYEDTRSDPKTGTAALNKLITKDEVQCVIGDVISSVILAVAPIAEKNRVVLMGFGESAEITKAGDYIFRNWNSAASDAQITGSYAASHGQRFVVLNQNDAFGISCKSLFVDQLNQAQATIVMSDEFAKEQTDFRTILSRLKNVDYDGLYVACFHSQALLLLKQYKELGLKDVSIYGVSSWEEKTFIDFATINFPDQVFYGYPKPPDSTSTVVRHFQQAYDQAYGQHPEILCDNGYDALMILRRAIVNAGVYQGKAIKDQLYQIDNFEGASGTMSFDRNGDVHKSFGLKMISRSGIVWVHE